MSLVVIRRAVCAVLGFAAAISASYALAGSIEGTVTSDADGSPLGSATMVAVSTTPGGGQFSALTDPSGAYLIDVEGSHFFVIAAKPGYDNELYEELPCCDGGTAGATIVALDVDSTQTGVDFTLTPQAPAATVTGVVRRASDNAPIAGVSVDALDANQTSVATTTTAADGSYSLGVQPGTYVFAATGAPDALLEERYPNVQCGFQSGTPTCVGTPTQFELTAETTLPNIDFAMAPIATLTLGLSSAATSAPINGVIAYRRDGEPLGALIETNVAASAATIELVGGGTIYVAASSNECGAAADQSCLAELNPALPCAHFSCDFDGGGAIVLAKGQQLVGPDFVLDAGARIAGEVHGSAGPLENATLSAYMHQPAKHVARGAPITTAQTDANGVYQLSGLAADEHYVIVEANDHVGELFDDVPCEFNSCELDGGSEIATTLGASSDGIDFDLQRVGAIAGRVYEEGLGIGISGVVVHVHNASGAEVRSVQSGSNGNYLLSGFAAGNYLLRFTHAQFHAELYEGLPCPGGNCDVMLGTPVVIASGATTSGIDAGLVRSDGEPPQRTLIYLNNCKPSGCVVRNGFINDSRQNTSTIVPPGGQRTLIAFSGTEQTWSEVVQCVRDVMAPYYIDVTDIDPGNVMHHEAMIAGIPSNVGFPSGVAGVSPFTCGIINNSITFTFANLTPNDVLDLCWTATQEIAHSFGLSHEMYCPDSMTYLAGCGFKRYTDVLADIGTQGPCQLSQECQCGPTQQNSHQSMLGAVGPNIFLFSDGFEDDPAAKMRQRREQLMQKRGDHAPIGTCATMDVAVGRRGFVLPRND